MTDYTIKPYNSSPEPDRTDPETDVLDWSNLIPVPPERPCRKIRVRLRKAEPDKPIPPSENDFPLTSLDDLDIG